MKFTVNTTFLGGALLAMAALQTWAVIMEGLQEHGERKGLTSGQGSAGRPV